MFRGQHAARPRLQRTVSSTTPIGKFAVIERHIFYRTLFLCFVSGGIWLILSKAESVANYAVAALFIAIALYVTHSVINRRLVISISLIGYLAAVQPLIREYTSILPYLAIEYAIAVWFGLMLLQFRTKYLLSGPLVWYSLYILFELLGLFSAQSDRLARGVLVPSLMLWLFLFISGHLQFSHRNLHIALIGYLVGTVTMAAVISQVYSEIEYIRWSTNSNFATSGGMGPVQVGFILSVGCFICLAFTERLRGIGKAIIILACLAMSYVMILTFARGGLYIFAGAALLYLIVFKRPNLKSVGLAVILGITVFFVFQLAISVTDSVLIDRYSEQNTSNRLLLVQLGWNIFLDNPVFGVGTSNYHHVVSQAEYFGRVSGAHNEIIRAAAEHGIFGLVTWTMFAVSSVVVVFRGPSDEIPLRLTLLLIAFISTFYNGLKLVAQPTLFLLALSCTSQHARRSISSASYATSCAARKVTTAKLLD